jgi:hypothetical protein
VKSGHHDGADRRIGVERRQSIRQCLEHLQREGVALLRAIERHYAKRAAGFDRDICHEPSCVCVIEQVEL